MFIVTNRTVDEKAKGLHVFGSVPNPKGPNELRLIKMTKWGAGFRTKVLGDKLSQGDVQELKEKFDLNIDMSKKWYASLSVACQLFEEARQQKKHILCYVHGYNNDLKDVINTSMALEDLYNVIVVPFTWPANGGGAISGAASYLSDKQDALVSTGAFNRFVEKIHYYHTLLTERSTNNLWEKAIKKHPDNKIASQEYFTSLQNKHCEVKINLLSHSMGNYLLKHSLLPSTSSTKELVFDNISLVSADTNNKDHKDWVERIQVRNRLYIVINENDFALAWSRRKPGQKQLARLGHYLKNLNTNNADYIDVTSAAGVENKHKYFTKEAVEENNELKKLFCKLFEGKSAEEDLSYRSDINAYKLL